MNERIKELIAECETTYVDWLGRKHVEFDKEKFAELIVRECRVIVSENFHECSTASKMDRIIKEHFGVEK